VGGERDLADDHALAFDGEEDWTGTGSGKKKVRKARNRRMRQRLSSSVETRLHLEEERGGDSGAPSSERRGRKGCAKNTVTRSFLPRGTRLSTPSEREKGSLSVYPRGGREGEGGGGKGPPALSFTFTTEEGEDAGEK